MKHYLSPTNELFAYELDGSQDHLIPNDFRPITDQEADAFRQNIIQERINSMTYADKRAAEYPSIKDQLDVLYHSGYDGWKSTITAIKNKYPKQ